MQKGFWGEMKRPIWCMAPMADVTDRAFREMFVRHSKGRPESVPYVSYTEFVSADGLFKGGFDALEKDLSFGAGERPIVAQFFSPEPMLMKRAAMLARERGFDGVDINMGCPDANVCGQGSGAALIKNAKLAREIIRATKEGAGDLPVSVKTRIGYTKDSELEEWLPELLAEEPAVIILHARTKKDMSKVPARWENIARAVAIRDSLKSDTLIIGNGDVRSLMEARSRVADTGCDGVMIGRGLFGNPWAFANSVLAKQDNRIEHPALILPKVREENVAHNKHLYSIASESRDRSSESESDAKKKFREISAGQYEPSVEERLHALTEHAHLFEKEVSHKPFHIMKKHFKAYVAGPSRGDGFREGFSGAKELRQELMETENAEEVGRVIDIFLKTR